jgi:hypothetical protein
LYYFVLFVYFVVLIAVFSALSASSPVKYLPVLLFAAAQLEICRPMHYDLTKHGALVERKMGLKCWNNGVVEYWSSGNSNT